MATSCMKNIHFCRFGQSRGLRWFSSVLRLDQPNYSAYFYLKESICSMSMKPSGKFVIGVVINLPKYFESHFGHVTRNDL